MDGLANKKVLLGISGGIAAYKTPGLVRALRARGAEVRVVMTHHATRLIGPSSLQAVSGFPVRTELFDQELTGQIGHIELARWPDAVLVAPATANLIGHLAGGLADDLLTTLLLATTAPVLIAPSMNSRMLEHPAVQANLERLRHFWGISVIPPEAGELACLETGPGRLADIEVLVEAVATAISPDLQSTTSGGSITPPPIEESRSDPLVLDSPRSPSPSGQPRAALTSAAPHAGQVVESGRHLEGLRVLVTLGPTREWIDDVRYLSNASSGRMGFAMCQAARRLGAEVVAIAGPTELAVPPGIAVVRVESALDMEREVMSRIDQVDVAVFTAAVADVRPTARVGGKIAKANLPKEMSLTPNPDILARVAGLGKRLVCIGFAAETSDLEQRTCAKCAAKGADFMVGNDVSGGAVFGQDETRVVLCDHSKVIARLGPAPKSQVAAEIWNHLWKWIREIPTAHPSGNGPADHE